MTDKPEVTQAEYGRIHADGSRSGGQPPSADLVEAVARAICESLQGDALAGDLPPSFIDELDFDPTYWGNTARAALSVIPDPAALVAQLTAANAKIAALTEAGDNLYRFVHHVYTAVRAKWEAATNAD